MLGPWLKDPLEKAIRDRVIAPDGGGCRVVRSELGFAAAVRGGAQISLDQVFVVHTTVEAAIGQHARRVDHRGHAGFHVLRAAAVQPAVAFGRRERIAHAGDADGVGMAAEHQRAAFRAPLEHAHDVRAARRDFVDGDVEPGSLQVCADGGGDFALTGSAGHERRIHGVDGDQVPEQADGWIHGS